MYQPLFGGNLAAEADEITGLTVDQHAIPQESRRALEKFVKKSGI